MTSRRPTRRLMVVLTAVVATVFAQSGVAAAAAAAAGPHQTRPEIAAVATSTTSYDRLIVEPAAGPGPIDALLRSPIHRLDLVMYELVDPTAESILEADAARGVVVRVILDRRREGRENLPAYDALVDHGVAVSWAPARYEATHEKAMVIDAGSPDAEVVIMTLNLTARYYPNTRDVAVVDTDPTDVSAVESTFSSDLAGDTRSSASPSADLVWSPGSEPALVSLIDTSTTSVEVENEEMSDRSIVDALIAAARRGVDVTVVMTVDTAYTTELSQLGAAGVHVQLFPDRSSELYIHAKVIVVDGTRAFVGSQNFTHASLDRNRELGVVVAQPDVVAALATMVAGDATAAPLS